MEWFNSHTRRYVEVISEHKRRQDQEREDQQETGTGTGGKGVRVKSVTALLNSHFHTHR
jgi:hypothetical protein